MLSRLIRLAADPRARNAERVQPLNVESLDERRPFLERIIADGMLHLACLFFSHLRIDAQMLGEELEQEFMAPEHRRPVFVPLFG